MVRRDFSGEELYKVLVNVGGFRHVRTTGDHLILRWDPPDDHTETEPRIVVVPAHDSVSIGTLRDIADDAGAKEFEAFCSWIDRHA
jgi:predicted RNA binding protein YcfA (HicA-like mRNA interferase family)